MLSSSFEEVIALVQTRLMVVKWVSLDEVNQARADEVSEALILAAP